MRNFRSRLLVTGIVLCGIIVCLLAYHRHRKGQKIAEVIEWMGHYPVSGTAQDVNEWAELGKRSAGTEGILLRMLDSSLNRRWEWLMPYEGPESWDVAHTLFYVASARSVSMLIEVLEDKNDDGLTRVFCAAALGNIGDHRAFGPPCKIVESREDEASVRVDAVQSLTTLGDPKAIPVIEELIRDDKLTESNRRSARLFLDELKEKGLQKDDEDTGPL